MNHNSDTPQYQSQFVQTLDSLLQRQELSKLTGVIPTSAEGIVMAATVRTFGPLLPKYLHKLDENEEARLMIADILRSLVAAADKDARIAAVDCAAPMLEAPGDQP